MTDTPAIRRDADLWAEVAVARGRAHAKHGDYSIESLGAFNPGWLPILVEEVGEVAHTLTYDARLAAANLGPATIRAVAHLDPADYALLMPTRAELIDVLAVASAWVDRIDGHTRTLPAPIPGLDVALDPRAVQLPGFEAFVEARAAAIADNDVREAAAARIEPLRSLEVTTLDAAEDAGLQATAVDWTVDEPAQHPEDERLAKLREQLTGPPQAPPPPLMRSRLLAAPRFPGPMARSNEASGPAVVTLRARLTDLGYNVDTTLDTTLDTYDYDLEQAVYRFQWDRRAVLGLGGYDGIVGPRTWRELWSD